MPPDNAEVVRESFRRWERADFDGLTELWHEDAQITSPEAWPEAGPFIGRDSILEQFKRLGADFDLNRLPVKAVLSREDWVVIDYEWTARGHASGLENRLGMSAAFRLEDGRFREGHFRRMHAEALEAAGLSAEES